MNLTQLQPPSGGCVLKPQVAGLSLEKQQAAAFGRLCVETSKERALFASELAAAFGRLCVETENGARETGDEEGSRLRAAVC